MVVKHYARLCIVQMLKMKIYFCLIFLLCGISCSKYDEKLLTQGNEYFDSGYVFKGNDEYHRKDDNNNNSYGYYRNTDDRYYDEEYIGNPDFDAMIERPCRVFDLNCIRRYFAEHSKCKIRRGPLPDRFFNSQVSFYLSRVNATATLTNNVINVNKNTRIEEFYINRRTNRMVFSIEVKVFIEGSYNINFEFFRANREPIVVTTEGFQSFPSVTFTATIPNIDDLELKEAEIIAFTDFVVFFLGPEVLNNTDPTVTRTLVEIFADTRTDAQETFLTDSQLYLPAYIQFNICDFGLSIK